MEHGTQIPMHRSMKQTFQFIDIASMFNVYLGLISVWSAPFHYGRVSTIVGVDIRTDQALAWFSGLHGQELLGDCVYLAKSSSRFLC